MLDCDPLTLSSNGKGTPAREFRFYSLIIERMEYIAVIGIAVLVAIFIGFIAGVRVGRVVGHTAKEGGGEFTRMAKFAPKLTPAQENERFYAAFGTLDRRLRTLQSNQIRFENALKAADPALRNAFERERLSYYKK